MLEKYLELSQIYQQLLADYRLIETALEKLRNELEVAEHSIKQKDLTIADLTVDNNRLRDMLKLKIRDLEDLKKGYRIPSQEEKPNLLDRIFRGVK